MIKISYLSKEELNALVLLAKRNLYCLSKKHIIDVNNNCWARRLNGNLIFCFICNEEISNVDESFYSNFERVHARKHLQKIKAYT